MWWDSDPDQVRLLFSFRCFSYIERCKERCKGRTKKKKRYLTKSKRASIICIYLSRAKAMNDVWIIPIRRVPLPLTTHTYTSPKSHLWLEQIILHWSHNSWIHSVMMFHFTYHTIHEIFIAAENHYCLALSLPWPSLSWHSKYPSPSPKTAQSPQIITQIKRHKIPQPSNPFCSAMFAQFENVTRTKKKKKKK